MAENMADTNRFVLGLMVTGFDQLDRLEQRINDMTKNATKMGQLFDLDPNSKNAANQTSNTIDGINDKLKNTGKTAGDTANNIGDSFDKSGKKIKKGGKVAGDSLKNTTNKMKAGGRQAQAYSDNLDRLAKSSKASFGTVLRRVTLWSAGIGLLFGSLNKVKDMFQAVKDIEVAMVELQKVMSDETPFKVLKQNLFGAGIDFSVGIREVMNVGKIWAQQGKNFEEVSALTRTALLAVNSANMTAIESTEFLTSATKSYNVEAENTARLIDSVMRLQAGYAVTAQDLANGFKVAAAAGSTLGEDMHSLFGYIAAVGEITRETGSKVGNALKTHFARLYKPDTIRALSRFEIVTQDARTGEKLAPRQIYKQIAEKYKSGSISDSQLFDISLSIGGIRKYKDVLILLKRFDVAEEARIKSMFAYGQALEASDKTQDTLTKRAEKMSVAFDRFGDTLLGSGIMDFMKGFTARVTDLANFMSRQVDKNWVDQGLQALPYLGMSFLAYKGIGMAGRHSMGTALSDMVRMSVMSQNIGTAKDQQYLPQFQTPYTKIFSAESLGKVVKDEKVRAQLLKNESDAIKRSNQAMMKFKGVHGEYARRQIMTQMMHQNMMLAGYGGFGGKLRLAGRGFKHGFMGNFAPGFVEALRGGKNKQWATALGSATASVGRFTASLAKGAIAMAAMVGAIKLAGKAWGIIKNTDYFLKRIDLAQDIDVSSDASKAYFKIYEKMGEVTEKAFKNDTTVEDYVRTVSDTVKDQTLRPIMKELGERLYADIVLKEMDKAKKEGRGAKEIIAKMDDVFRKHFGDEFEKWTDDEKVKKMTEFAIRTRDEQVEFFKQWGLAIEDGKQALEAQIAFYHFLRYEMAKQREQILNQTSKISQKRMEAIDKELKSGSGYLTRKEIISGDKVKYTNVEGTSFTSRLIAGLVNELGYNIHGMDLPDKNRKIISEGGIYGEGASTVVPGLGRQSMGGAWELYYDDAEVFMKMYKDFASKGEDLKKFRDALDKFTYKDIQLKLDDQVAKILGPAKQTGEEGKEAEDLVRREMAESYGRMQAKYLEDQFKRYNMLGEWMVGLINPVDDAIHSAADALDGFMAGLIDAEDKIFNATSDFVAKMQQININEKWYQKLGIGFDAPEERLSAAKDYVKEVLSMDTEMQNNIRQLEEQYARTYSLLAKSATKVDKEFIKKMGPDASLSDRQAGFKSFTALSEESGANEYAKALKDTLEKLQEARAERAVSLSSKVARNASQFKDLLIKLFDLTAAEITDPKIVAQHIRNVAFDENKENIFFELMKGYLDKTRGDYLAGVKAAQDHARNLEKIDEKFEVAKIGLDATPYTESLRSFYDNVLDRQNASDKYMEKMSDLYRREPKMDMKDFEKEIGEIDRERDKTFADINLGDKSIFSGLRREIEDVRMEMNTELSMTGNPLKDIWNNARQQISILQQDSDAFRKTLETEADRKKLDNLVALEQRLIGLNAVYEEQKVILGDVTNATENVKSAMANMFSSDEGWLHPGRKGLGLLKDIMSERRQYQGRKLAESLVGILGDKKFGAWLLGVKQDPVVKEVNESNNILRQILSELRGEVGGLSYIPMGTGIGYADKSGAESGGLKNFWSWMKDAGGTVGNFLTSFSEDGSVPIGAFSELGASIKKWFTPSDKPLTDKEQAMLGLVSMSSRMVGEGVAHHNKRSPEYVGVGSDIGGIIGSYWGSGGSAIGSFVGSFIGAMFGEEIKGDEEELLKEIVENTASLKDIDSRVFNAPTGFNLPALAKMGGNMQMTNHFHIDGASDPRAVASTIANTLEGIIAFNNVHENI